MFHNFSLVVVLDRKSAYKFTSGEMVGVFMECLIVLENLQLQWAIETSEFGDRCLLDEKSTFATPVVCAKVPPEITRGRIEANSGVAICLNMA